MQCVNLCVFCISGLETQNTSHLGEVPREMLKIGIFNDTILLEGVSNRPRCHRKTIVLYVFYFRFSNKNTSPFGEVPM